MKKPLVNYAFIDSQNLNLGILDLGWKLDFKRFRIYLKEKYGAKKAFLCIGYVRENRKLYNYLQDCGYELVFKPTIKDHDGKVKGNVDAELVLQVMHEYDNYERAIIVSGDGDFYCLIKYLSEREKLLKVCIPNPTSCSRLIKLAVLSSRYLLLLDQLRKRLEYKNPPTR